MRAITLTTSGSSIVVAALALTLTAGVATTAQAAGPVIGMPKASSVIGDDALSHTSGAIQVNEAAGSGNAQQNSGAIAIGPSAAATIQSRQRVEVRGNGPISATTKISNNAFDGASGWIGVNQSAGQGNAQSNGLAIVLGGNAVALTDVQLARVDVSPKKRAGAVGDQGDGSRTADIANTAFSNVSGVVQVNQSAGRGNFTANRVHVRVEGVAAP